MGQMVDDVRLAVDGSKPVYFYGRAGGMVPTPSRRSWSRSDRHAKEGK